MSLQTAIRSSVAPTEAPSTGLDAPPRLLIVDDIGDNRTILSRRFLRRGYEVMEAESGAEALALIDRESFDAVLLDVMMPGIDGIEVLRRIRSTLSPLDLPVIMVTAKSQSEDIVEALELKANDYVTKPVDFAVALARVTAQIDRKRAEDEIKRANASLKDVNDSLEKRIAERTVALVEANRQLKEEIQQRQRSEAEIRQLALHDALTGLANRVLFRDELEKVLATATGDTERLAVLFIDLDGFKGVNDSLGHSIGDVLLKDIAQDLRGLIAGRDVIARLGGDEFAILHHCDGRPDSAARLAERIIRTVAATRSIDGQMLAVGASVGIVVTSGAGKTPEELLRNADLAMYKAKADGRGIYRVFDPAMDAMVQERRQLEVEMLTAFVQGQFRVYYQPLISLGSNRICGFEALLRWQHPERGLISPVDFVPVAEDTGLIVQLDDWVLREACMEAAKWGDDIRIGVNVSPVQFTRGNIVNSVIGALAVSGLKPSRLEIEITESVLLEGSEQTLKMLTQLRQIGARIVMDDFGTGYSSLGYLRAFQFDKIKIDQSFVRDIAGTTGNGAIVQAIAELGRKFGIATTAEGVETQEQLQLVISEGCSEAQGWIFSQPIPASKILALLTMQSAVNVELLKQCVGLA
ncbi:EAL domain-containing protein [Siculibacillus lacustris]|uniref:EAL domain-containing protein n=1 Tax=Siculibacillus lacustris TaxID=1549641 RepID=A0A4Q9VMZ1_9HYPH|nr:EAL domain-containing protein [Siculibacillus lacustris]TBW36121.1 EAL domain-containing protein [Siculibacillus lacustris]